MEENQYQQTPPEPQNENLHIGLTILSFCIPIAGAIIYFTNKDQYPKKARTACYAALIGIGVGIILNILVVLMGWGGDY